MAAVTVTPSAQVGASVASAGSCAAAPSRHAVNGSSGKPAAAKSSGQWTLDETWAAARAALSSLSPTKKARRQDSADAGNAANVDKEQSAAAGASAGAGGSTAAAAAGSPAGAAAAAGNSPPAAAVAGSVEAGASALELAICGPWHVHGFGLKKLT